LLLTKPLLKPPNLLKKQFQAKPKHVVNSGALGT
jgi:hypothetical protein